MKTLLAGILFTFTLLFLSSCSKESTTEPAKETKQTFGSAAFRIDKVNAPSNVSTVKAYLSRQDCDTLVKKLNISDSASQAEMLFENIKTGLWHLNVVALGNTDEVLYSGETDIFIEDSKTTEVYLTLMPVQTGVGNVYINIKWGSSDWTDYSNNPIFTKDNAYNNPYGGTAAAKVLFENGKYRMWYMHTYESGHADINYAESVDGYHWHNTLQRAVLSPGAPGSWDSYMVGVTAILKDDNGYKMYYAGCSSHNNIQNIGLAYSSDGINWQKYDEPVMTGSYDESGISATAVVKKDGTYYMYFASSRMNISVAVSQNGVTWERKTQPVVVPTEIWESSGIVYPTVIYDGQKFVMIYKNWDRSAFGMATSEDGIKWTKYSGNPIFEARNTSSRWASTINYPWLLMHNNQYKLYYTGVANGVFNLAVLTKNTIY